LSQNHNQKGEFQMKAIGTLFIIVATSVALITHSLTGMSARHALLNEEVDMGLLITALGNVESSNNPNAIGDGGRAWGLLQIHKIVVDDVNRIHNTTFIHEDALDPNKAKTICALYLAHWGEHYESKTSYKPNYSTYAKMWNGGPSGWEKPSTNSYWRKVANELLRLKGGE
jgi:hypothetical protein